MKKHKLWKFRKGEYITSNFELIYEEDIQKLANENHRLNNKINKAIEYIEKLKFVFDFDKDIKKFAFDFLYTNEGKKLLKILKGEKL